jgi:PAS domain S-box-containing protein
MAISLDDVLVTTDLARRPARPPDYEAENRALVDLAVTMAESPQMILQKLAEVALVLCRADSAGISVLEPGGASGMFRWNAIAGQFASYMGGQVARENSPCGTVLDREVPLLFSHPERHFDFGVPIDPPIVELLLVPFHVRGKPAGTIWVIAHTPSRKFDTEDQRVLTSLSRFMATAFDLKKATTALQEREQRLRLALDASGGGSWTWDARTNRVDWDDRFRALYGFTPEEMPSFEAWLSRVHEEDRGRVLGLLNDVLRSRTKDSWNNTFRIVLPNGTVSWIESLGRAHQNAEGQVSHLTGLELDITERRRTEEALRSTEARLRVFLENSPTVAWLKDEEGRHVFVSPSYEKRFGVGREDWQNKTDFELWPKEAAEQFLRNDRAVLDAAGPQEVLESAPNRDGTISWWLSNKFWFRDASGKRYVGGIGLDVTDRKRAEEALRQSEEQLELALRRTDSELTTIVKTAPIGIVTTDLEGRITSWNDAAERIFGYTADEVVGRLNPAIPDEALAEVYQCLSSVVEGRTVQTGGERIKKDGSVITVSLTHSPHYDEHGVVRGAITLVEDITEKRNAETALARVRSALAEIQTEEARRIARDLHDDISQRLALLSLDIDRMASMPELSRDQLSANFRSCQEKIVDICEGLRQISHRMHPSVLEHLGLPNALKHLCRDFSQREGIHVRFHSDKSTCDIPGTMSSSLYRVAQEALRNISKHAKAVDVEVNLTIAEKAIRLSVVDSGDGFDTSAVKSGLGLHSMRERAELVGGAFSITSEPGSGTRILVSVPLQELASGSSWSDGDCVVQPNEQIECQTRKFRLLIGDDHPLFAAGVAKLLEDTCEIVGTAGDGLALVESAERLNPDLVLIDISMPVMNGFDAARQIRKSVPGAKLLFLTTHSNAAYADEAFKSGANGYLVKQAASSELRTAIATVLDGRTYRSVAITNRSRGTA